MNCREFKSNHVGFVDDLLSAFDMAEMRGHLRSCRDCSALDVRIRRSLLIVRNLPQIEPSPDFYLRLTERLNAAPSPVAVQRTSSTAAMLIATAALAAAIYFAVAGTTARQTPVAPAAAASRVVAASQPVQVAPAVEPTLSAAVPAGVPVWPAMFMAADLPAHLTTVDLAENGISR